MIARAHSDLDRPFPAACPSSVQAEKHAVRWDLRLLPDASALAVPWVDQDLVLVQAPWDDHVRYRAAGDRQDDADMR